MSPCVVVAVQLPSHVHLFVTLWTAAHQASLSFTISWCLLRFMSIELVMLPNYLIPFSSCPQSFPASGSFPVSCIRWPKYWSFSLSPSNEYSRLFPLGVTGLISLLSRGLSGVFSSSSPYVAWASPVKVRALLAWRQHSRVHQNQTDLWIQTQSTLFTWTQLLFFSFLIW